MQELWVLQAPEHEVRNKAIKTEQGGISAVVVGGGKVLFVKTEQTRVTNKVYTGVSDGVLLFFFYFLRVYASVSPFRCTS